MQTDMMRIRRYLACLFLLVKSVSVAAELTSLEGEPVPPLTGSPNYSAFAYVFMGTDCPISNRLAPEIERLHQSFSNRGILLRAVYAGESAERIRAHRQAFSLTLPALIDATGAVAQELGVTVTPEVVVYLLHGDNDPVLNYRGRINDLYSALGQGRPAATRHDLKEVLDAIAARSPLPSRITKAVGCHVGP
jgi:thiol-disulfide isomerase/thioredoxin